jgi:methionine-rich copper-binding protein CopC
MKKQGIAHLTLVNQKIAQNQTLKKHPHLHQIVFAQLKAVLERIQVVHRTTTATLTSRLGLKNIRKNQTNVNAPLLAAAAKR